MVKLKKIELLAPAKNLESGKVAINYGADAVYIGADRFGARAAAGNPVADIASLVQYAHKYQARVFVALNTILFDHELEAAEKLIRELYDAGIDALIIQDMGILKMDIPPIPLHASTQTHNYELDRIRFLDQVGFERIILARELSLSEVRNIRSQTSCELEYFVHGSLCVSLSGQCYFSQTITGRSANRGMCAQMCRHPYNLLDGLGNKILVDSHLLSLKDLNLSGHLQELIDAGVSSLKIEGRLKDQNYVKNVVSYYRQKLDHIFESDSGSAPSSSGKTRINFEPDPERSFSRGSSDYFFAGRNAGLVNRATPKSMGKRIGPIDKVGQDFISVQTDEAFHNGDGLCFIKDDQLYGFRVEKVVHDRLYVNDVANLSPGMELYRNYDHEFNKMLDADKSLRKVDVNILVTEGENQLHFVLIDEDDLRSTHILDPLPELARDAGMSRKNLVSQLSRSGPSMFDVTEVEIRGSQSYFLPLSAMNKIRRILFEKHEELRSAHFSRKDVVLTHGNIAYPSQALAFSANISNQKASQFYLEHDVKAQEAALEIGVVQADQLLMTTRYCIKYEMGYCPRFQTTHESPTEPLYLEDQNRRYLLQFDCQRCLMHIRLAPGGAAGQVLIGSASGHHPH